MLQHDVDKLLLIGFLMLFSTSLMSILALAMRLASVY